MEEMRVTIIGQEIFNEVEKMLKTVGLLSQTRLTYVNPVNRGMLGNLKTITYIFGVPSEEVVAKRKALMKELARDSIRLIPMYVYGDWMRICVFKAFDC